MSDQSDASSSWGERMLKKAITSVASIMPSVDSNNAAMSLISDAVSAKIQAEAATKAQLVLSSAHRTVIRNVLWQNGLLILSIGPVFYFRTAIPFYIAYACVAGYTLYSLYQERKLIGRLCRTRSITKTLALEVRDAIDLELTQRQFYERKVVEWLGPCLNKLSEDVARKLRPDVVAGVVNMAFTLFLAFIAFRVFIIPFLEKHALSYGM